MRVSVALFTSDLRLHDNPVLRAAVREADAVVPLFVRDSGIEATGFVVPNRMAFLADCLADLDTGLRRRGGRLIVRSGEVVEQVCALVTQCEAGAVHVAAGVSLYAQRRERRLREALEAIGCRLTVHDAVITVVAPGQLTPQGNDHFAVFTPFFRRWSAEPLREPQAPPREVRVPERIPSERLPERDRIPGVAPGLAPGGEGAGRERFTAWLRSGLADYDEWQGDLGADATSRLSPYLHFGALSPVEVVHRARSRDPDSVDFVRQMAWRDFHYQLLAARPRASFENYRERGDRWRDERIAREDIEAWREGRTGYPVVDAAMRQMRHEGWMHNRARLLVASFLTKTLYVDWRIGARFFLRHLVDGDIPNNQMNWQWVAGTGVDTRFNRVLNPVAQGRRYDPDGEYVRRWVPALEHLTGSAVHEPWKLPEDERAKLRYPDPLIPLSRGLERFKEARELGYDDDGGGR
ncbi:deoxyribodipyrimidine photo-lyase [Streptomyces sp. B6B3]|uniref:cryptochrome/photolyase family protein n=1 Tax=Streptomyces sp. B6B3 TaxID=3153570 RepID=UPI00325D47AC